MEAHVELSEIQHFYKNCTVLVTGATGFVGKLLLEKILRNLYAKHVYVLVRAKDGVDAETRCADIFDSPAFGPLKRSDPDFFKKVSLILGDCEQPDLGLNDYDRKLLVEEVNCIFHSATSAKLDEGLRTATLVNVRATRDLLKIAEEAKNLKTFVYLSTAYSNFPTFEIHEEFYEPRIPAEKLLAVVESLDDEALNAVQPTLLGKWPNTFTFTKNAVEDLLKRHGNDLPISVVRPSIIIPSAEEPVTGFVDNLSSLAGFTAANATGVNRVNYYKNGTLDVIPVDYVVNQMIASGWYSGLQRIRKKRGDIGSTEAAVYHCISSQEKPLTSDEWMGITYTVCRDAPTSKMLQLPVSFNTACYYNYKLLTFILHTFMAYLCDTALTFVGKAPGVVSMYEKLHKQQELFSPFLLRQWYFSNDNSQKLLKRMSFKDRELFNFDIFNLNWTSYFPSYARGVRVYILKDPMSTLSEGKKRQQRKLVLQVVSAALLVATLYIVGRVLFKIFLR